MDNVDELRKYKTLLDEGAISQEDFDKKKAELLGSDKPQEESSQPIIKHGKKSPVLKAFAIIFIVVAIPFIIRGAISGEDSVSDFVKAFNNAASIGNFKYRISNLKTESKEGIISFNYVFDTRVKISGIIEKSDGNIVALGMRMDFANTSDTEAFEVFYRGLRTLMTVVDPVLLDNDRTFMLAEFITYLQATTQIKKIGFIYILKSSPSRVYDFMAYRQ
jgi:hypothetical protein